MSSDTQMPKILVATHSRHLASHVDRKVRSIGLAADSVEPVVEAIHGRFGASEPGIVVLDALHDSSDAVALAKAVAATCPKVKVAILGANANPELIAKAILAKASEFLLETMPADEFGKAINDLIAGEPPSEDSVYGRVLSLLPTPTGSEGAFRTPAGRRLLPDDAIRQCDSLGLSVDEIADHLKISIGEVERVTKKARKAPRPSLVSLVLASVTPEGGFGLPSKRSVLATGALLAAVLTLVSLYSREPRRHQISGEVSYQGQPVKIGLIRLTPQGDSGSPRPIVAGTIRDGKYTLKSGHGSSGGNYRVQISGFTGVPKEAGPVMDPLGEQLFPDVIRTAEVPCSDYTFNVKCDE